MSRLGWVEGDDKFGEIEDISGTENMIVVEQIETISLDHPGQDDPPHRRRRARLELQHGNEERSRRQVLVWKAVLVFGLSRTARMMPKWPIRRKEHFLPGKWGPKKRCP